MSERPESDQLPRDRNALLREAEAAIAESKRLSQLAQEALERSRQLLRQIDRTPPE